jgi:hypothetical protein
MVLEGWVRSGRLADGRPLPRPEDVGLPAGGLAVVPVPESGLTLFRLLEADTPREKDFEPRLSRNQARIRNVPELLRMSLSHWLTEDQALNHSQRRRTAIAELHLLPGGLTHVALTEEFDEGHVDVWGHPRDLLNAVARVVVSPKRL